MNKNEITLVSLNDELQPEKANTVEVVLEHRHHENHNLYNKDDKNRFAPESEISSVQMKCTIDEIPYLIEAIKDVNQSILNYEEQNYTLPATDEKGHIPVSKVVKNKFKRFVIPVVKERGRKIGFAHVYLKCLKYTNENGETSQVKWL